MKFGFRVLIIKTSHSGRMADVVYRFFRHPDGYCQMEENTRPGWQPIYLAVPVFDHCGEPRVIELTDGDFVRKK